LSICQDGKGGKKSGLSRNTHLNMGGERRREYHLRKQRGKKGNWGFRKTRKRPLLGSGKKEKKVIASFTRREEKKKRKNPAWGDLGEEKKTEASSSTNQGDQEGHYLCREGGGTVRNKRTVLGWKGGQG